MFLLSQAGFIALPEAIVALAENDIFGDRRASHGMAN
jgi:hypothetical protein